MLGSFKKLTIIKFTNKITSNEDFDDIHNFVLGGIIKNI